MFCCLGCLGKSVKAGNTRKESSSISQEKDEGKTLQSTDLSMWAGGGRTFAASCCFFPADEVIVSPSDVNLSTKLSTSFPLAPSFSALLEPDGLK